MPPDRVGDALRGCPNWTKAKHRYFKVRAQKRWVMKYKPYVYPDGTRWAAPYPVAICESGENYYVGPYGAYGLILEPPWQSPKEQDEDAYRLMHTVGEQQAWANWEGGCYLR